MVLNSGVQSRSRVVSPPVPRTPACGPVCRPQIDEPVAGLAARTTNAKFTPWKPSFNTAIFPSAQICSILGVSQSKPLVNAAI
jgi:hypothetical protein